MYLICPTTRGSETLRMSNRAKSSATVTRWPKASVLGGLGGGIGATLAAIFAVGTAVVIPGLGLVVAGPIAAALAGAGAGGAAGGLIGALVGAGIPEERANAYERGLKQGGIVLGTRAKDKQHAAELEREFGRYGGNSILR